MLAAAILTLGGAALFRLRGSVLWSQWTGRGATTIRLIWAAYLAGAAWLCGLEWQYALALLPAFWLGSILPWWGSLDMTTWQDFVMHSLRGALWTLPAAWVLLFAGDNVGSGALLATGWSCGVIYLACWKWFPKTATETAEWIFGGSIAGALLFFV